MSPRPGPALSLCSAASESPEPPGRGEGAQRPGVVELVPRVVSLDVPGPPPGAVTLASTPVSVRVPVPGTELGVSGVPDPPPRQHGGEGPRAAAPGRPGTSVRRGLSAGLPRRRPPADGHLRTATWGRPRGWASHWVGHRDPTAALHAASTPLSWGYLQGSPSSGQLLPSPLKPSPLRIETGLHPRGRLGGGISCGSRGHTTRLPCAAHELPPARSVHADAGHWVPGAGDKARQHDEASFPSL